jgi:hypothetical protein
MAKRPSQEARIVWDDFSQGMRRDVARGVGSALIENFDITDEGWLKGRNGYSSPFLSSASPNIHKRVIRYSVYNSAKDGATSYSPSGGDKQLYSRLMALTCESNPNRTIESGTSNASDNTVSFSAIYRELYTEELIVDSRMFAGRGAALPSEGSTVQGRQSRRSACIWETDTPETVRNLGREKPTTPTAVAASSGTGFNDLTASRTYGFVYTHYNSNWDTESEPSSVVTQATDGSNKTIVLTITKDTDEWDQIRVYRTEFGYHTASEASKAVKRLIGTYSPGSGSGTETLAISEDNWDAPSGTGTPGGDDGASYTLDYIQNTSTHQKLFGGWQFAALYAGRLWVIQWPNALYFTEFKAPRSYPDHFPTDNYVPIGSSGEVVTGLVESPSGDGLIIFSNRKVILMRGSSPYELDFSMVVSQRGCTFPRTIRRVGNEVYYLGTDRKVYVTDGQRAISISNPIQPVLNHIKANWQWALVATAYQDSYKLAFPSGPYVSLSAPSSVEAPTSGHPGIAGVAFTHPAGTHLANRYTYASADLSKVKNGMLIASAASSGSSGGAVQDFIDSYRGDSSAIVTAINDGDDTLLVEGAGSVGTELATTSADIVVNDRVLSYDTVRQRWTQTKGWDVEDWSVWDGWSDRGQLVGSDSKVGLIHYFDDPDATLDGSTAITSTWKSAPLVFKFKKKAKAAYVYMLDGEETAITVKLYVDRNSTAASAPAAKVPEESDNRYGLGGIGGRVFELEVSSPASGTIYQIELEMEDFE